ncbi:hypothetical protein PANI_CDS0032 [Maribacter phage Panino]
MKKVEHLRQLLTYFEIPDLSALNLSMNNVHYKGMFSLVIQGSEFGKLKRVFIAGEELREHEVQFHTHRYPITLTVLKGTVRHHTATPTQDTDQSVVSLSIWDYLSPLNGGVGLTYHGEGGFKLDDYSLPETSTIYIEPHEYHTMSVSKGAIWVVEEYGFETEGSKVLGVPFILDDLYTKPKSFQTYGMFQRVKKQLKSLINNFDLI